MIEKSTFELLITALLTLPLFALATWRMSSLLAKEEGPCKIFERVRQTCGVEYDLEGFPLVVSNSTEKSITQKVKQNLGGLLICEWCSSIWIGFFWTVFFLLIPKASIMAALPFAISAGAIYVRGKIKDD